MLDNAAVVALGGFALLILAHFTYGRFIARRIYQLDPNRPTPAHTFEDGVDYVPARLPVLFGHHFASIAGLGPILGPAIAVIWGWVPAVLWVLLGCIFIGAVHDLGALTVSLRYKGHTIGDVCKDLIGPRARLLALLIIFFLMALAMGAFVNAISGLFVNYNPDAIIPSFGLILLAMCIGVAVYRLKAGLGPATAVGLLAFTGLIFWGVAQPVPVYEWFTSPKTRQALDAARDTPPVLDEQGEVKVPGFQAPYGAAQAVAHLNATGAAGAAEDIGLVSTPGSAAWRCQKTWIVVLLVYAFFASVLPVWLLLQPRDYINSFQLYFALATLLVGLTIAAVSRAEQAQIDAPTFRPVVPLQPIAEGQSLEDVPHAPPWFPLLFVTIACGAVSGFHALVSSGTTVRQLNRETDAWPIGYGAMLTEGALAILVIMACVAGLGAKAWQGAGAYASWSGIKGGGLAVQLSAVVQGGAAFLGKLGIPPSYGKTLLAVTIVSFAMTTLDTATRLLRFNVEEICRSVRLNFLANRYFGSLVAVAGIAFFGLVPAGKILWTLFGTTNQLLASLTLLTISVFLFKLSRPVIYTVVPMIIMLVVSVWAMTVQMLGFWAKLSRVWEAAGLSTGDRLVSLLRFWSKGFWEHPENSLIWVCGIVMVMSLWLIVEALLSFARGRGGLDFEDEPGRTTDAAAGRR